MFYLISLNVNFLQTMTTRLAHSEHVIDQGHRVHKPHIFCTFKSYKLGINCYILPRQMYLHDNLEG